MNPNRLATTAVNKATHSSERSKHDTHADRKASSTSLEIQRFEIELKMVKIFLKVYDKELEEIESNCHVKIPRKAEGNKLYLKPKDQCSADDYEEACSKFISLYQKMYQLIKMERFSLKSETKLATACRVIGNISKKFPILVKWCIPQGNWELYGEASHIEEALKYLKEEGVGINRKTENTVNEKGRCKQEAMNVDPTEKDVYAEVLLNAADEFVRQGDAEKKKITDIRFENIDDPSVQAFRKEFKNRYGDNRGSSCRRKALGRGTSKFSTSGVEVAGFTMPTSRTNRDRGLSTRLHTTKGKEGFFLPPKEGDGVTTDTKEEGKQGFKSKFGINVT